MTARATPTMGRVGAWRPYTTKVPEHAMLKTRSFWIDSAPRITPVRFIAPGDWTVRFHFYENCYDASESPRGHGVLLIHVP